MSAAVNIARGATAPVRERPLLMSAPMVRATLDDLKTQTRRVMKRQLGDAKLDGKPGVSCFTPDGMLSVRGRTESGEFGEWFLKCPYGVPGDRLVLLSSWATEKRHDRVKPTDLPPTARVWTRWDGGEKPEWCGRLRPGRFLPSKLRHILPRAEVTDIRVERLLSISEEDARAEGFSSEPIPGVLIRDGKRERAEMAFFEPRAWFMALWAGINGPESVKANPWLWCLSFRLLEERTSR